MLAGPTAPPEASCSEPSNLAPASQLPAHLSPSSAAPLAERAPQPQQRNPHHNLAKKREKVRPIIHILKGWEMAFAFQHGKRLKISCEFPPRLKIAPQ